MATVTGILTFNAPDNSIVSEVTVRVWDEDFRSRELLGEVRLPGIFSVSATYTVEYSSDQFEQAEALTADVSVEAEATTPAGKLFGASEITFNARDNIRIDVVLQPVAISPEPRLSELEQLLQALEPIRQGVDPADFTLERDIPFLVEELVRRPGTLNRLERIQLRQRLQFSRSADQLAHTTQIPLAAFYGWFRRDLPTELNALLDLPITRLREELEAAIRENIIPDITAQIPEILDRIRSLRFQEGRLVSHRFVGLLIDDETDQPLAGYSIRVEDLDAEPEDQAAGTVYTDGQGFFILNFVLPGDAPEGATRRLLLTISEDETENLAVTEVLATANQDDVAEIRVQLRDDDRGNVPIQEVAPIELAQRLQQQGITTLQALLANPDLTDDTDSAGLERLRAVAKLRVLTPNLDDPALLLESGNLSLLDVGRNTRADFVRTHHERLGDAQAASLQFAAKEYRKVMSHLIGSAWLQLNTSPDDEDGNDNIPPGVRNNLNNLRRCDCRNCQSAVSPGAYLAHLLDWTLDHIKDVTDTIEFDQLEEEFHQPFRDLPTSCQAVEERVRQVRICVEVLWRYTGLRNDPEAEDEGEDGGVIIVAPSLPTRFQQAYTEFLNGLYQAILANLGTSYDQLRRVQLHLVNGEIPPEELIDPQRQSVADLFGIDVPHLNDVFLDIYRNETEVTELQLQTIFGFKQTQSDDVLKPPSRADLITWQRERLELIWQQQDWMNDAYSGERSLPLIDPILIDESYLRLPVETNPAFSLLQERQTTLANHRQQLVNANPQENGLAPLLENELGQLIDQLRTLYTTLQTSNDATQLEPAQATVASFNLTLPAFTYLMDVDARIENQQAIAPTEAEVAQVWENIFEILSSAHRRSLFPAWIEAENQAGILLSPKLFWLPLQTPPAPNSWQAAGADRQVWEDALRDRYTRRPIIDPNQIKPIHLTVYRLVQLQQRPIPGFPVPAIMPPLDTYELWQERDSWVTERLAALEQAREGQNTHLADFAAMLAASTLGGGLELFDELADLEAQRGDLALRLEQLNLTLPEYRYLTNIFELAENNASIAGLEWQQVGAILVNGEKRREFFEWRLEEQSAEITLHPHRFQQLKKPIRVDRNSPLHWLSDTQAQEDWEDLLRARYDQFDTLTEALARAVSDAEGLWLPKLRDALILESNAPGDRLLEKADWLDKLLLVDMQMSGCHTTTRVSQAIETLQRFIRGVYTGEHPSLMQHLKLDSEEDYETEWPVLGSYPTWRAFMLTYLFPENLLHVSPPLNQSFGFTELKRKLPSRVAPEDACVAAAAYADYYRDVCHLEVQASCQVLTRMSRSSACESSASDFQVRVHLFAIATTSGKVYTATFDPALARDLDSTWQPINRAGIVERIIGAVPHKTPDQQRFILLFIKVEESGKYKLKFIKRNLDELDSWSNPKDLSLPLNDGRDFTAASIQKRVTPFGSYPNTDFPTILAIQSSTNDIIYLRHISPNATGWSPEEWLPLSGPDATSWRIDRYNTSTISLKALIQYDDSSYAIFSQTSVDYLKRVIYRLKSIPPVISPLREIDDLEWRWIGLFGSFHGAFTMTESRDIFVFAQEGGITDYKRIRIMNQLFLSEAFNGSRYRYEIRFPDDIKKFDNEWLKNLLGISLEDFNFSNFNPSFFVPKTDPGTFNPFEGKESEVETSDQYGYGGFNGSLLDLLTLLNSDFKFRIPEDAFVFSPDNPEQDKGYYKVQLQFAGVEVFLKFIEKIDQVDFLDETLDIWKLANHYIQLLSEDRLSLADLVGRILDNVTLGWINSSPEGVAFFDRDSGGGEDIFESGRLTNYSLLPASGGDGLNISQTPRRAVVISQPKGTFITTARRQGEGSLRWDNRYRITPNGSGPFDLTPLREKQDLETRGQEIRIMYVGDPGLVGSPASVMMYLKEAYNLVPLYLGYQLQLSGYYEEALLWYRQVFDYLQVPNRRKIDYSLRLEEDLPFGFRDSEEWLDDATNAHAIAATRKETYTRHVLLLIIRCLIDYGDRLFSHDNVADNARAKELYILALKLLDLSVLRPGRSSCGDTIGTLEIEVGDTEPLPIAQLQVALSQIQDPNRLRGVVTSLQAIHQDTSRSSVQRLTAMRETVQTALAEIPPPKKWNEVRTEQQSSRQTLENHYLAQRTVRTGLQKVNQQRYQVQLNALETISDTPAETLLQNRTPLPWLRQARPEEPENGARPINRQLLLRREVPQRIAILQQIRQIAPLQSLTALRPSSFAINQEISFEFCIPQNPVITALRTRAENNLAKLRQCRNIAGLVRQIDPYGAPIEIGGIITPTGQIFSGIVEAPPTIYRYAALIARAKELVNIAQQIESGYQAALESAERETMTRMLAEQSVGLADARVALQDLRLNQVNNELGLAQLQRSSAEFREQTYAGWIAAGQNEHEETMLAAYKDAADAQKQAARASAAASVAQIGAQIAGAWAPSKAGDVITGVAAAQTASLAVATAATLAGAVFQERAIDAEARAQAASFDASFERSQEQWELQSGLANFDVQIGNQQIVIAEDQIAIVEQEKAISVLEQTHAADVLEYLLTKNFTEEMYLWIASVLQDVYRFFLQEAASVARLAMAQAAFEGKTAPLGVIQPDYWQLPADSNNAAFNGGNGDRLGLTGSARLLKDIYQLDQYAFQTRQSYQSLTLILDLAQLFPAEFQLFRQTGEEFVFATSLSLIHRQFPGYYLCLIQQVSVSIVALTSPTDGIRASVESTGISQVVVGGDTFQTVTIRNLPERIALTSPTTTAGIIELEPDAQSLLRPFEGSGFATNWRIRMPKAINPFNYNSMATILFTVELSALHSFDYEQQILRELDNRVSANRAFQFRNEFADQWYDLNNPDQTSTPMVVRFETRRTDFPHNIENLKIQHVLLYFIRRDGADFEVPVTHLHFTEEGSSGVVGGGATSRDGAISTRSNAASWTAMIGKSPFGAWELSLLTELEDGRLPSEVIENEDIEDILFVITYSGRTPEYPM